MSAVVELRIEVASEDAVARAWRRSMGLHRIALVAQAEAYDAEADAYEIEAMLEYDKRVVERLHRYVRANRELAEHSRALARGDRDRG